MQKLQVYNQFYYLLPFQLHIYRSRSQQKSVSSKMIEGMQSNQNQFLQKLNLLDDCLLQQTQMQKCAEPSLLDATFIISTLESLWIQSFQQEFKEDDDGALPAKQLGKLLQIVNYNKVAQNQECLNLIWSCIIQVVCNAQKALKSKLLDLLDILVEIITESFAMVQPLSDFLPVFQTQQMMYISVLQLLLQLFPQKYSLKTERYFKIVPKILRLMCEILTNPDSGVLVRCVAASIVQTLLQICKQNKIDDPMFSCYKISDTAFDAKSDSELYPKAGIQILFDVLWLAFELNLSATTQEDSSHIVIGCLDNTVYQCLLYIMRTSPQSVVTSILFSFHHLKDQDDKVLFMLMPQAVTLLQKFGQTLDTELIDNCFWSQYKNITQRNQSLETADDNSSSQSQKVLDPIFDPEFIVFGQLVKAYCQNAETKKQLEDMSVVSLNSKNEMEQVTGYWMLGCMATNQPNSTAIKDCLTTNRFLYNHSVAHWCVSQYLERWMEFEDSSTASREDKSTCVQQWITDILKNILATQKVKQEEQSTLNKIQNLWGEQLKEKFTQGAENINAEKLINIFIEFKQFETIRFLLKFRFFNKEQIQSYTIKLYNVDKLTQVLSEVQSQIRFEIIKELVLQIQNFGEQIFKTIKLQMRRLLLPDQKNQTAACLQIKWTLSLVQFLVVSNLDQSAIFLAGIFNILQTFSEYFAAADLNMFMSIIQNILTRFSDQNSNNQECNIEIKEQVLDEIFTTLINLSVPMHELEFLQKKYELIFSVMQKLSQQYWNDKCQEEATVKNCLEWFFEQMDGTLCFIMRYRNNSKVWPCLSIFLAQCKCISILLQHFWGQIQGATQFMQILLSRIQILWSLKNLEDCRCESNSIQRVVIQCLQEVIYMPLFKQAYEQEFHAEWLFAVLFFAIEEIQTLYLGLSRHLIEFLELKMATILRVQSLPDKLL
eukprot:TRINITY_DN2641_c0_g1_i6.p1 TRINITY_DN2641_c0_g1~~TRINITY_DN2641_c0_g1_i6.p1  ORF type:complete len:941 (-),score=87.74 TRINITY_DN2641_c0_g1_i6:350-3172(-)